MIEKKECEHASLVLTKAKHALLHKDALKLKDLSNQVTHMSCLYQDAGSITATVLIYTLSKLVERQDYKNIRNWDLFVKKFNSILDLAVSALEARNQEAYSEHMLKARKTLETISPNIKPYIESVLKKASINKASKLHEHGISLEQTSKLLGISKWELSDYIGEKRVHDDAIDRTITVKSRAKLAMEFFS